MGAPLRSDQQRHHSVWDKLEKEIRARSADAVEDAFTRGVRRLLEDPEYFDRQSVRICMGDEYIAANGLHEIYIRATQLLELEEKRAKMKHWTAGLANPLALRQLRAAASLRAFEAAKARGAH